MIRTHLTISVPNIAGDGQSLSLRHTTYSNHPPAGFDERQCRAISAATGWPCERWATATIRVNGTDYGICTTHGGVWLAGNPITFTTKTKETSR